MALFFFIVQVSIPIRKNYIKSNLSIYLSIYFFALFSTTKYRKEKKKLKKKRHGNWKSEIGWKNRKGKNEMGRVNVKEKEEMRKHGGRRRHGVVGEVSGAEERETR